MRRARTTLILAAVAALLGGYILFVERHQPSTDEARASRVKLLPRFDRGRASTVRIARAGAPPYTLERGAPGAQRPEWVLRTVAGGGAKAVDEVAVDALLAELDFAESDRDADVSPAEAGLAPPRVALTVEAGQGGAGGARSMLALGRPAADGRGVFAQVDGAPGVRVGPRRLLELADREAAAFRDRRVLPSQLLRGGAPTFTSNAGVSLTPAAGRWRNQDGAWVSNERVDALLQRLGQLTAIRFPDDAPPPTPAHMLPSSTMEIAAPGQASQQLVFFQPRTTACSAPQQETLDRYGPAGADRVCIETKAARGIVETLVQAATPDDRLLPTPPDAVTAFALEAGARRVALSREGGRWRYTAPAVPYQPDDAAVAEWLAALARVRLPPAARATATMPTAAAPAAFTLAVTTPRFSATVSLPKGALPPATVALLDPDITRFRDRRALDLAQFDVQALRVVSKGSTVDLVKSDDQSWRAVAPSGATVDGAALDGLLAILTNLRAERFLPPEAKVTPDETLTLTERPPGAPASIVHVVELGPRRPDGCVARLRSPESPAAETTLLLAQAACESLRAPVVR